MKTAKDTYYYISLRRTTVGIANIEQVHRSIRVLIRLNIFQYFQLHLKHHNLQSLLFYKIMNVINTKLD